MVCMHQDARTWRPEISSIAERLPGRLRFNQLASCRLYCRFGPCRCTQLDASIVEIKIDRPLRQAGDFCDLSRGLPTRDPSQHLDLTIMQRGHLRPYLIARDPREPGIDDRMEHVKIDRLSDVIIRP